MIKVNCIACREELEETGAILLTSPIESGHVAKYHICRKCEKKLAGWLVGEMLECKDIKKGF